MNILFNGLLISTWTFARNKAALLSLLIQAIYKFWCRHGSHGFRSKVTESLYFSSTWLVDVNILRNSHFQVTAQFSLYLHQNPSKFVPAVSYILRSKVLFQGTWSTNFAPSANFVLHQSHISRSSSTNFDNILQLSCFYMVLSEIVMISFFCQVICPPQKLHSWHCT